MYFEIQSRRYFDYHQHPSHTWDSLINQESSQQRKNITIRILWGLHEDKPGACEFDRIPRQRFEKILYLAEQHGIGVNLVLGFFPSVESFPRWALKGCQQVYIPAQLWNSQAVGMELTPIPSLQDKKLQRAFLNFTKEVFQRSKQFGNESAISNIGVDLSLYEVALGMVTRSALYNELVVRYRGEIGQLNRVYKTTFANFDFLERPNSLRLLSERRPWMAAYDYHWVRRRLIAKLLERAYEQASVCGLPCSPWEPVLSESSGWSLLCESTCIENVWNWVGFLNHPDLGVVSNLKSYQRIAYFTECAEREGIAVRFGNSSGPEKLVVVLCGKFIPRQLYRNVCQGLIEGKSYYFPFGFPRLNENMEPLEWPTKFDRVWELQSASTLQKCQAGSGQLWLRPNSPLHPADPWIDLSTIAKSISDHLESSC